MRVPAGCGRNTSLFIASPGEMWTAASDAIRRFCRCACMRSAGKPRTRTTSQRSARHCLPLVLRLPLPLPPLVSAAELRQFTIYDLRPHRRRSTPSRSTATSMRRSGCTGACSTSVRSSGQACRQSAIQRRTAAADANVTVVANAARAACEAAAPGFGSPPGHVSKRDWAHPGPHLQVGLCSPQPMQRE